MDPATLLLITQILSLAAQAAASIPAIKNAFTQQSANTTAELQAQTAANLQQAEANLQLVVQHAQAAFTAASTTPTTTTA